MPREPFFEIRKSRIQGRGAFALRRIRKGTRITEYTGERIDQDEADRRYDDAAMKRHHTFLFTLDAKTVVDGREEGNIARFINHSCEPNCEAVIERKRIFVEALSTIEPGGELLYDYQYERNGESDAEAKRIYPCWCGTENCRGTIMAPRKKPKKKRKAVAKAKKSGAKKKGVKKAGAKKSGAKKSGAKKSAARKSGAQKRGTKKAAAKNSRTARRTR